MQDASNKTTNGFTIIELIVATSVSVIMCLALVGFIVALTQNFSISTVRNTLTADTQTTLNRVSDDVRKSAGFIPYNFVTDANAPTGIKRWVTTSNQLVLAQVPRDVTGKPLNLSDGIVTGSYDSIVYYLKNGVLYRRIVAAPYVSPSNVETTQTCPTGDPLGGCPKDTKISTGVQSLSFALIDKSGAVTTDPFSATSVLTSIELQRSQAGRQVRARDSSLMAPRQLGEFSTHASLAVGAGGLGSGIYSSITGTPTTDAYVQGGISLSGTTSISAMRTISVANKGCGIGANFGLQSCSPAEPIDLSYHADGSSINATEVCATGQISSDRIATFMPNCNTPTLQLPRFNKQKFTLSMISSGTTPAVGCVQYGACPDVTLGALTKYTGNYDTAGHTLLIAGNAYITGSFNAGCWAYCPAHIQVANGITVRPIVVVNGKIAISNNTIVPNNKGITPIFISFYSTNASKSNDPAYSSTDQALVYDTLRGPADAIALGTFTDYQASFYAYYGALSIDQSSNITGTVAGQRITLTNHSSINLTDDSWPSS